MNRRIFTKLTVVCFALFMLATIGTVLAADGKVIYELKCAKCHGADGQGDPNAYKEPLFGDASVAQLARLIERTMPEEEPEDCVGEEAQKVATYVYEQFYSLKARHAKGLAETPPVALARLTVNQYRNVVADLLAHFTPPVESESNDRGRGRRRNRGQNADAPIAKLPDQPQPGLRAEYFQSKGMSKADTLRERRIDPQVDFDFGEGSPVKDIDPDQFTIIFQGALTASDTGHYEFRVSTENGARLYLNLDQKNDRRGLRDDSSAAGQLAMIDAWVSSGKLRTHSARTFLVGGRQYNLRLEFFKYKEKTASIKLEWKPPHGGWQVLDHHHLSTANVPRVFVVETPFPADDRSLGYERGNSMSREWYSSMTNAAIATADEVIDRLPLLASLNETAEDQSEQLREFVLRFASVAFRRPLTVDEDHLFSTLVFQNEPNAEAAVRRAILIVLKSPHFLYADLTPDGEAPDSFAVASRLALTLWDSIPDNALSEAAENGELETRSQIESQARRMLTDQRAKFKMRGFFHHWLEMEERDLSKDEEMFPNFNEQVVADLRFSLEQFIDQVVWSESSDYRQLLLADYLVLNERLRKLYLPQTGAEGVREDVREGAETANVELANDEKTEAGSTEASAPEASDPEASDPEASDPEASSTEVRKTEAGNTDVGEIAKSENGEHVVGGQPASPKADSETANSDTADGDALLSTRFERVDFPPERRAGVLTHPYLLSAFAYHNNTSPIHRGVFLTRNVVGRGLKPPPMAVAFKDDQFDPSLTMREKITELTRDQACMSCHSVINPLGFALENYDAVGRWRTSDNHKLVDTKSEYTTEDGISKSLQNARDIANLAVESDSAHRAFVMQVFEHLAKNPPFAFGPETLDTLHQQLVSNDFNIQNLMVDIALVVASRNQPNTLKQKANP